MQICFRMSVNKKVLFMETVLNLSLSIASIYISHPIICQSCPDMSDDKTVRRQSGFHNKSDNKVGELSRRPESKSSRPTTVLTPKWISRIFFEKMIKYPEYGRTKAQTRGRRTGQRFLVILWSDSKTPESLFSKYPDRIRARNIIETDRHRTGFFGKSGQKRDPNRTRTVLSADIWHRLGHRRDETNIHVKLRIFFFKINLIDLECNRIRFISFSSFLHFWWVRIW